MRNVLVLLLVFAVLDCRADDAEMTVRRFASERLRTKCQGVTDCSVYPEVEQCIKAHASMSDEEYLEVEADIALGYLRFDPVAAEACLEALAELDACERTTEARQEQTEQACEDVYLGNLNPGASCSASEHCVLGTRCVGDVCGEACCLGTCTAYSEPKAGLGESCWQGEDCGAAAYCNEVCVARRKAGETCQTAFHIDQCEGPAFCVPGVEVCMLGAERDGVCDPTLAEPCRRMDDHCDPIELKCKSLLGVGTSCDLEGPSCVFYARCESGQCTARPNRGEPCDSERDLCLGSLHCGATGVCEGEGLNYCPVPTTD